MLRTVELYAADLAGDVAASSLSFDYRNFVSVLAGLFCSARFMRLITSRSPGLVSSDTPLLFFPVSSCGFMRK